MFELSIVFDCIIIFSIEMPSVFAQSVANDEKAGLVKCCKRDFADSVALCSGVVLGSIMQVH